MSTSGVERLKVLFKKLQSIRTGQSSLGTMDVEGDVTSSRSNPVDNYYHHKVRTNLPVFYRYALQTRSIEIRDTIAESATELALNFSDLLSTVQAWLRETVSEERKETIRSLVDSSILLALADLLINTARDDLDTYAGVNLYSFVRGVFGMDPFQAQQKLQYVEALNEIGQFQESAQLVDELEINSIAPLQRDLLEIQRVRRSAHRIQDWLSSLNRLYETLGMTRICLLEDQTLALMDRLVSGPSQALDGPKVSVIMPTYSPGPGIHTAIRSLLEQTWQNLEIIVVDDASPDNYRDLFNEIVQLDPRIRLLQHQSNEGAYVARNTGLAVADGDFITIHDDDDWSHPDKIALQVGALLDDNSLIASTSAHIRTTENVEFRRVNVQATFLQLNYSSLMFRKSIIEEIGNWDTVNRGGDSEFYMRLIEFFGEDRVANLTDRPLSFSRVWDGSLTSGEMFRGYFAYSRLLYRWAFRQWQWEARKAGRKAVRSKDVPRPYAIPTTFETRNRNANLGQFDVVYATDFFRQAKYVDLVLNEIKTLIDAGLRVGYMHLYSPETSNPAGFPKELFDLQLGGKLTQVSLEDTASTKILLVYDASIGMFSDQLKSPLISEKSIVIMHKLPELAGAEKRSGVVIAKSLKNLDRCFTTKFKIVGATPDDQHEIRLAVPEARRFEDANIWNLHVRQAAGTISPPDKRPTVGFHSYGNRYRWPRNVDEFTLVYRSPHYRTRLYGQYEIPLKKYGSEAFLDIELMSSEDTDEEEFLAGIDFWVYYPHERLQEQLWEPVLKAMQAGKVVILPPTLEHLYGNAAVYADMNEVADTVVRFTADVTAYRSQVETAQTYIAKHHTKEIYLERIASLQN